MKQVMTDLESMSRRPNGAIVSIGAVLFDETMILGEFEVPVSLQSCIDHGLDVEQSTVDWWAQQSPEARASWDVADPLLLPDALAQYKAQLRRWGPKEELCMWANGPDFDLVMLKSAYRAVGEEDPPWAYWNHRCFRTMKTVFPTNYMARGVKHSALTDARNQAFHLMQIMENRGMTFE